MFRPTRCCLHSPRAHTVRLGCMVGGMTYRNPAFLVKTVTCLDVISRVAIWGIGAGWFEKERGTTTSGSACRPLRSWRRAADREEHVRQRHHHLRRQVVQGHRCLNGPSRFRPADRPFSSAAAARKRRCMVAQYGDACNVFGDAAHVRHRWACSTSTAPPSAATRRRSAAPSGHTHRRRDDGGRAGQAMRLGGQPSTNFPRTCGPA